LTDAAFSTNHLATIDKTTENYNQQQPKQHDKKTTNIDTN